MATTSKRRKRTPKSKPLPTIWEIPDDLWLRIKPILEKFWPRKLTGRRHANWRLILNGIIFRMRSGCQWDQLPRKFGPKSTVHDWFQRWCADGVGRKSDVRAEIRCQGGNPVSVHHSCPKRAEIRCQRAEIRCQFIILARKDELTSRQEARERRIAEA